MMNKRQRERIPQPVTFGPPDWIPLEAAFFRMRDCLGSRALAARDLHQRLLNSHLKGARRGFDSNDAEIEAVECDPDFWQGIVFKARRWPLNHDGSDPGLEWWLPAEKYAVTTPNLDEMHVFVRRAELDQLYPEAKSEQAPVATGFPRKDSRGTRSEIDWEPVLIIAASLMARHKYRRLVDLKNAVYEHFKEEWPRGGPDDSTLDRHLSPLHSELKAALSI
jgi:hypothetical protein